MKTYTVQAQAIIEACVEFSPLEIEADNIEEAKRIYKTECDAIDEMQTQGYDIKFNFYTISEGEV